MATWRGEFRERGKNGSADRAWTTDGDNGEWVDKADYQRFSAYSPPWDELRWTDEED